MTQVFPNCCGCSFLSNENFCMREGCVLLEEKLEHERFDYMGEMYSSPNRFFINENFVRPKNSNILKEAYHE